MGLQDGRRIVVQVLREPEVIGPDDLLLSVRVASYENKSLSRVFDVPLPRQTTVDQLYAHVLAKLPHLNEEPPANTSSDGSGGDLDGGSGGNNDSAGTATDDAANADAAADISSAAPTPANPPSRFMSIATGFRTGPPLTLKSALKLKWNDPAVLSRGDNAIDHPPLNLRDGSLLVVRGIADFERAKAAVKARREAEGTICICSHHTDSLLMFLFAVRSETRERRHRCGGREGAQTGQSRCRHG
jgi:hypothetical protein